MWHSKHSLIVTSPPPSPQSVLAVNDKSIYHNIQLSAYCGEYSSALTLPVSVANSVAWKTELCNAFILHQQDIFNYTFTKCMNFGSHSNNHLYRSLNTRTVFSLTWTWSYFIMHGIWNLVLFNLLTETTFKRAW